MAGLEYLYLEIFRFDRGCIPNLEAEVNDNPSLFYEAVRMAYKERFDPQDVELFEKQKKEARIAHILFSLLSSPPGVDEHGVIETEKLKAWILKARCLSEKTGHRSVLDQKIGEIIARAPPADDGVWPCDPVREAVNDLYSSDLELGILIGRHNSRGAYFRGEGGAQERELAEQYESWAAACEFEHPRMAAVLREMAKDYTAEAEWHDNEAMIRKRMRH